MDPAAAANVDDATWAAYEAEDQDQRRARWAGIAASWALAEDELTQKLIAPLRLEELIDLDCSLTSLRHEVRRAISKLNGPRAPRMGGRQSGPET